MKRLLLALLLIPGFIFATDTIVISDRNSVVLDQQVDSVSCAQVLLKAIDLDLTLQPGEPIYLVLNTPGGSVLDGMILIDALKGLGRPVHTITIFAASMGYQIVQNMGTRYILPSGTLMSHRASGGARGEIEGEVMSRLNYALQFINILDEIAAKRVGISLAKYKDLIADEYWVMGKNAVDANHADEVALVKCDKSLDGIHTMVINSPFGSAEVTMSNCPLITAPLSVKAVGETDPAIKQLIEKEVSKRVTDKSGSINAKKA